MAVLVGVAHAHQSAPSGRRTRPEPWICRKNSSTGRRPRAIPCPPVPASPLSISARGCSTAPRAGLRAGRAGACSSAPGRRSPRSTTSRSSGGGVQRVAVAPAARAAAAQQRLVVAGDQALVGCRRRWLHAVGREVALRRTRAHRVRSASAAHASRRAFADAAPARRGCAASRSRRQRGPRLGDAVGLPTRRCRRARPAQASAPW